MYESEVRQVLLDLVTTLNKEGGLDNKAVAKLHFDLAYKKIEAIFRGHNRMPKPIAELYPDSGGSKRI